MPFRAEKRDTLGTGHHVTYLISHVDDDGNSMRLGHFILPMNLSEEFAELFKEDDN